MTPKQRCANCGDFRKEVIDDLYVCHNCENPIAFTEGKDEKKPDEQE